MKILVVDDERAIAKLLSMMLEEDGHQVEVAHDGSEGLGLLRNNCFDLAFLDHNMPELTGIELVKHIRQHAPHMKTVIISGYENLEGMFVKTIGATEFLRKPFSRQEIRDIISRNTPDGK